MLDVFTNKRRKTTLYSILLMLLTSIHHIYGAVIYHTPWRLHVLLLSLPVIALTFILNRLLSKASGKKWIAGLYWFITLTAILLIGVFEGLYNHVLKNVLFFSGLSTDVMRGLYPEGTYEMPNDLFFELTGILQGIIVIPMIYYFIQFTSIFSRNSKLFKSE